MAGGPTSPLNIPNFLRARTARGLVRAMIDNNAKFKHHIYYFQISHDGSDWYAWFYVDLDMQQRMLGGATEERR